MFTKDWQNYDFLHGGKIQEGIMQQARAPKARITAWSPGYYGYYSLVSKQLMW